MQKDINSTSISKQRQILNLIAEIRNSHSKMEEIFLNGSCLNFHMILRSVYPESEPYFNINHIITKIDDKFYDITGIVNPEGYIPYNDYYSPERTRRSFKQMYFSEKEL